MEAGQQLDSAEVEGLSLSVSKVDPERKSAAISLTYADRKVRCTMSTDKIITSKNPRQLLKSGNLQIKAWIRDDGSVRFSILNLADPVASIESKRVGAQRFSGTEKLGSGIQTIEKAKQASLVAVDFDLKYNGTAMAIGGRDATRPYRSFVILGNGVHWTDHDLSVLDTYVDYTYLMHDSAIVRYAEYVREKAELAGEDFFSYFMSYFKGLTKTVADDFEVRDSDFVPVRPKDAAVLQDVLKKQFVGYPVNGA
jgi:carbon monoxide dehydrogenase subunit G